jgi:uncharacterized protein
MIHLKKTGPLTFFLLAFAAGAVFGQVQGKHTSMAALVQKTGITLRWFPNSYQDWALGKTKGYRLYRTLLEEGSPQTTELTKTPIKPLDAKLMLQFFEGNAAGTLAAKISLKAPDSSTETNDLYMALAMQASAQDPLVAKTMGLIFTDTTFQKGALYRYTLELPSLEKISLVVNSTSNTKLIAPDSLMATYAHKTATLKWRMTDSLMQMAYLVERSDDNAKSFRQINPSPLYLQGQPDTKGQFYGLYVDTLQVWYKQYYYRVRAITPFGVLSEASSLIGVYSYRDKIPAPVAHGTALQAGNLIHWTYPDSLLRDIQGFRIFRASAIGQPYTEITDSLLAPDTQHWLDTSPLANSYYRVAAIDWASEKHAAYPFFVSLSDSLPPATPQFKAVLMLEGNQVLLKWSANTEPDFLGYSVFRANHLSEEFSLITKQMKADTFLVDTLALGLVNPYLYYYVVAYDSHLNASPIADTLRVHRPDIIPPATPLIQHYAATDSTVRFLLAGSSSADVRYHALYRTWEGHPGVDTLAYFRATDSLITFVDTTALPGRSYRYEWVAYDQAGLRNADSSTVVTALFDQGWLPALRAITLQWQEDHKNLRLSWAYTGPVQQFVLYRAKGAEAPLTEYKYLEGHLRHYIETLPQPNTLYRYALMALLPNGRNTKLSKTMSYLIPAQP